MVPAVLLPNFQESGICFLLSAMKITPQFVLRSLAICMGLFSFTNNAEAQVPLDTEVVATGLGSSLLVTYAPGDRDRLFVVDQNGRIYIVKNGVKLATPYLDITGLTNGSGERGLLGLAFHPDYATNGWFYVNYTNNAGDTRVDRYTVSANPDLANVSSQANVLGISQPFSNHNGGCIRFGPDGYLYVGTGDGGSAGDPGNRAQNGLNLLGKMLRLDVDNGLPYSIPASNPFVGNGSVADEVWALGLRNPWRFNFDRETGDLYIADVGQNAWEYVHFQAASSPGGENYGWRIIEGNHCFNPSSGCNMAGLELPIYEYGHSFNPFRCAIIGSETYRGRSMSTMQGRYFFTDSCSIELWSFRYNQAGGVTNFTDHTNQSGIVGSGSSLGTDMDGELYICRGSTLLRVVPEGMYLKVPHLFTGVADTIEVARCTASQTVFLAFSLSGVGMFPVGQLGVTVMLDSPALAATTTANAAGKASFPIVPPGSLFGRTVWLEAVQNGKVSNVTMEVVE